MTPPQPLTIDELKGLLNAARIILYIAIGILDELTPNAKVNHMKVTLVATGQNIETIIKGDDTLMHRGACLGTITILRQARQLILSRPYPPEMRDGRQGWLDSCKTMMSNLERAQYE